MAPMVLSIWGGRTGLSVIAGSLPSSRNARDGKALHVVVSTRLFRTAGDRRHASSGAVARYAPMAKPDSSPNAPTSQEEREERLSARRRLKMGRSSQHYLRGSTARFYEWLRGERALPEGPSIWICGDCHYGNLGPVANAKDEVAVQIRDLDQAVIGNPAHDVIRLTLSLASAVRGFDLPGSTTASIVEQIVDAYQAALTAERRPDEDQPPTIKGLVRASRKRSWIALARERIEDPSAQI